MFVKNEQELIDKLAELLYNRTFLVQSDAEDLAWDVLNLIEQDISE